MKALKTDKAPAAIGPYSQAIEVNGFVFASGQIPLNPATGEFVEGGIKEQTRQALNNAREILRSAGLDLSNVVKTSVMLADIKYFGEMNEVYAEFFNEPFPARSAFAVKDFQRVPLLKLSALLQNKTNERQHNHRERRNGQHYAALRF